jgi:polyphosphate:AMP phosphotransferase
MFKSVELGRKMPKEKFQDALPQLRSDLLEAHAQMREQKFNVIFIMAGADAAGKGQVVQRLAEWLDPHGVDTHAFWEKDTDNQPEYTRYWHAMPGRGRIGIFFGSWYTQPMLRRVYGKSKKREFTNALSRITFFENMLVQDGTVIVKIWLHLSHKDQEKAIRQLETEGRATEKDWQHFKIFDKFIQVSEQIVTQTDSGSAPWHLVEAADHRHRDYTCGTILLHAIRQRLATVKAKPADKPVNTPEAGEMSVLDRVDLKQTLSDAEYEKTLEKYQAKLGKLSWAAKEKKQSMILVFEGWDAAGKGGTIRRVIESMDPRLYRVIGIAAPTDEERAQHYLWRFWRRLPHPGTTTIFDRSWYGRVLVERVEGFAPVNDWSRAYLEINDFEDQLTSHGIILNKFWLHISQEEQLRRFKERQETTYKQYKITDEDWRNRKKWNDYEFAVNEMIIRCNTTRAPWTLVAANDKRFARIQVLKTVVKSLEEAL